MTSERRPKGLLDTCTLIYLPELPSSALPVKSWISTITMAELGIGVHTAADAEQRAERSERLQRAEATFEPLPFTADAVRRFTHMAGLIVGHGRSPKPRRLDLMISAIASVNGLPLYTRNVRDFTGLDTVLTVVAV